MVIAICSLLLLLFAFFRLVLVVLVVLLAAYEFTVGDVRLGVTSVIRSSLGSTRLAKHVCEAKLTDTVSIRDLTVSAT